MLFDISNCVNHYNEYIRYGFAPDDAFKNTIEDAECAGHSSGVIAKVKFRILKLQGAI